MVKRYTKNPVGAHYGLADWLLQRLTAVVMAIYTVSFVGVLLWHKPATYGQWKTIFASGPVRLATAFFVLALLYHAWVGMRDIAMDYVKPTAIRLTIETLVGGVLIAYLLWAVSILWAR